MGNPNEQKPNEQNPGQQQQQQPRKDQDNGQGKQQGGNPNAPQRGA